MTGLPEEPDSARGGFLSTIEGKNLDMPHLTAFRVRLRELRALSRSSFSQSGEEHEERPGLIAISEPGPLRRSG